MIASDIFKSARIRTKMVGLVLVVILSLTLVNLFAVRSTLESALADQLEESAISITRDVASRSTDFILTNNLYALHRLTQDTLINNEDLRYVFFLDSQGNIMTHTFTEGVPAELLEANYLAADQQFNLKTFQTEEGVLRDVAAPVFDEQGEIVRIGVLDHSLQRALLASTRQMVVSSTITFIVAGFFVYLLTTITTIKPINALLNKVQAVSQGDLSAQVSVNTGDELSELADAFNAMTKSLDEAQRSRNSLMKRMISSQEDVRRRVARELHDETGQTLATLLISLRLIEEAEHTEELQVKTAEFRKLLLHSLDNVRLLAWEMSPIPLADLGLRAALEELLQKYSQKEGWKVEKEFKRVDRLNISSEQETTVYRVMQEALTNAAKHAEASEISVSLDCSNDLEIIAIFKDNGKGFDPLTLNKVELRKSSIGLASMEERISAVGGTLSIDTYPGEGTTIVCRIPL